MKSDYLYCIIKDCIHRRGCKRNLCNYHLKDIKELYTKSNTISEISEPNECVGFNMLDRFRNSNIDTLINKGEI